MWNKALLWVLVLLVVSSPVSAEPALRLPSPTGLGGHCGLLISCPESGPFGFHLRGTLLLIQDPAGHGMRIGGRLGASLSVGRWAEGGVMFAGTDTKERMLHGPVVIWGKVSPPWLARGQDERQGGELALQ